MRITSILILIATTACTSLTAEGRKVVPVTNPGLVDHCKLLVRVTAEGKGEKRALVRLRNAAGEAGADTVLWQTTTPVHDPDLYGTAPMEMVGDAYSCAGR